ncbi:AMP-binding protein [Frankia sp. AgB1.9]|uniref:AMP-binding protein n=1 Tax=unclassified Frankia TaxID=2632575 RepID=UPI0019326497|nr:MULTISPECIES: AMP-binding protein [unclassified Frankia]MBL7489842.1 AMP-binding protein [Frankia sp. AgW1.1]MBL7552698.1 AMP-binding protein [Frankia sp. AgB1.9]MBL7623863.1 AMP-binding protein [Frankia sp. AgB1.8]
MTTDVDDASFAPTIGEGRLVTLVEQRARGADAHRVYLTDARGGRRLTYGELGRAVRGWHAELDRREVPLGGTVTIAVAAPLDFALAYLGVVAGGRRAVPVPAGAPGPEFARSLGRLSPDLVVADPALGAGDGMVTPDAYLLGSSEGSRLAAIEPRAGAATGAGAGAAGQTTAGHDELGGVLLASSGTTGTPKQVFLDTGRLLHVATAVARHHRMTAADVGYNPLPLVHVNAEVVGLLATLVCGGELVLDQRFHRRGFWDLIEATGVTWINAVPAILAILAREPAPSSAQTHAVRFVRSASAPLPTAVLTRFETVTGLPVVETYGMTEAASQITANPLGDDRRAGSVGRPVGSEVRIVDPAGRPCRAGETGQVQIRGRGVIARYATETGCKTGSDTGCDTGCERFHAGGWLETGDLGRLDADGYLFLVGRTDDVINRGGEKIFPREVEEVLLADPRVARAVVFGVPDEVLGQVPVARVQLVAPVREAERKRVGDPLRSAGGDGLPAELSDQCAARLDRFKRPVRIEVVDDIPVGQTGKVLRRLVINQAAGDPAAA